MFFTATGSTKSLITHTCLLVSSNSKILTTLSIVLKIRKITGNRSTKNLCCVGLTKILEAFPSSTTTKNGLVLYSIFLPLFVLTHYNHSHFYDFVGKYLGRPTIQPQTKMCEKRGWVDRWEGDSHDPTGLWCQCRMSVRLYVVLRKKIQRFGYRQIRHESQPMVSW